MKNYWLKPQNNGRFPSDDTNALQQIADGSSFLDIISSCQFIQSELLDPNFPREKRDNLAVHHSPVLGRTMTGIVYLKNKPIQTFFDDGICFMFHNIYASKIKVISANLNLHTGEISFLWNEAPDDHSYVVSYEYNLEYQWNDDQ